MKFFRIITSNITAKSKLKLPSKFVKRYNVPRNARLRVPTGANWRVEVKKSSGGVWLGKGWVQFAESLGVKYGHFLVFDYDATRAVFHVVAIGMSAVETKYPAVSSVDDDDEEDQGGLQFKRPKIEDDSALMILENDADLGPERGDKARALCFELSGKSARASKPSDNEAEKTCGNGPIASGDEKVEPDHTTVKRETSGREIILNCEGRIQCVVQGRRGGNQTNDRSEKALQRAKAFKSEEPTCIIALQPSYVRLEPLGGFNKKCQLLFPRPFVEAYFNLEVKEVTLQTSHGRTWTVNYRLAGHRQSYFAYGWKQFAVDNDLKVGDVCLLELIRGAENALKVVIFRAMDEDGAPK